MTDDEIKIAVGEAMAKWPITQTIVLQAAIDYAKRDARAQLIEKLKERARWQSEHQVIAFLDAFTTEQKGEGE